MFIAIMLQARTFLNYKVEMGVPLHIVSRSFLCPEKVLLFFKFLCVYLLLKKINT
jgi:hypothetical protein